MWHMRSSEHAHIHVATKWHPTMNLATKCADEVSFQKEKLHCMTKPIEHCTERYKMELIYIQTRLNGQESPKVALKMKKIDNLLNSWPRCEQCIFINVLSFDR